MPRRHRDTELPVKESDLTDRIIGCAIEVHKALGPGLLESVYQAALAIEFDVACLPFEQQVHVPAKYRDRVLGYYRVDFVVDTRVIVEVKAVDRMDAVFESQVLTYLRVTGLSVALLINFNASRVIEGLRRFVM